MRDVATLNACRLDPPPPGIRRMALPDVQGAIAIKRTRLEQCRINPMRALVSDTSRIALHLINPEASQDGAMGGVDIGHR